MSDDEPSESTPVQTSSSKDWKDAFGRPSGDKQSAVAKERFGFVPVSILDFQNEDRWQLPIKRELMARVEIKRSWDRDWEKAAEGGHFVAKGSKLFVASQFNSGLARFLVRYYSDPGDVILDPFAGWGTRAYVSLLTGRRYIGFDVAKTTVDEVNKALDRVRQTSLDGGPAGTATIYLGDGIKCEGFPNGSADVILTCPPYHDSEVYEDCDREVGYQLSRVDREYFEMFMRRGFRRWYECLKTGGLAVFVIGDWREDGKIYPFGWHMQGWAFEAGFQFHDQVIHRLRSLTVAGIGPYIASKFVAKTHETVLVFKKPV